MYRVNKSNPSGAETVVLRDNQAKPFMMMSSNGNMFRVTGPLCREFTGHRWIPHTKASDAKIWCFLWSAHKKRLSVQSKCLWFETPWRPLWRHCNVGCWCPGSTISCLTMECVKQAGPYHSWTIISTVFAISFLEVHLIFTHFNVSSKFSVRWGLDGRDFIGHNDKSIL